MPGAFARCALVAAAVAVTGACSSFLNGDNLQNDPNNPTSAGLDNLFISAETNVTVQLTGQYPRTICIWMQQCTGLVPPFNTISIYSVGEDDYYVVWAALYGGAGLIDLRSVQTRALASGDSIYAGQAAVLEAMLITLGADIWGDIPYTQAANAKYPDPAPDSQKFVYDSLNTKLANAIVLLGTTPSGNNVGASSVDLVYAGDPALWTALAYTLRARIFLHLAKKLGPAAYDSAYANAQNGIQPGGDYTSINSSAPTSANLWSQFTSIYAGNMAAGAYMVSYMADSSASPDPRLPQYFTPNSSNQFEGGAPGQTNGDFSGFASARVDPAFLQPLVTASENLLIQAEAALMKTSPNSGAAAQALNAEQDLAGVPHTAATLHNVMLEKYIALFQNVEVFNDWKRTNLPNLTPAAGGVIPRRLVYPLSERNANTSITGPGPARNWNDPP